MDGQPVGDEWDMIFQTERRIYAGGEEEVVAAEVGRPVGSGLDSGRAAGPVLGHRHADQGTGRRLEPANQRDTARGWKWTGRSFCSGPTTPAGWKPAPPGFPGPEAGPVVDDLRSGRLALAEIPAGRPDLAVPVE